MNTIQDFENAPVGATATSPTGNIAVKTGRRAVGTFDYDVERWYATGHDWYTDGDMVRQGYILDPLPEPKSEPEPDWLDAPAVLAATILEDRSKHRTVFARDNKTGTQWLRDTKVYRWDELIDVVPLYPKGQEA